MIRLLLLRKNKAIVASAPNTIKGLLEVRGIGILKFPNKSNVVLRLAVELVERQLVERLPESQFYNALGTKIPLLRLYPFDISSAIKIEMALKELSAVQH